jgi:ADP-ribose pyrophosphatase YjhB (NUDIX family)
VGTINLRLVDGEQKMPERFRLISAVHVFLLRGEHIFLLRRANTGWGDGLWSVPAGHLEGDEQIIDAATREVREETGVTVSSEVMRVVGVMHRKSNNERIDFFLTAGQWSGEVHNAEPSRCSQAQWYPVLQLPADVVPYVRRALENYQSGRWFDSYGWHGEP